MATETQTIRVVFPYGDPQDDFGCCLRPYGGNVTKALADMRQDLEHGQLFLRILEEERVTLAERPQGEKDFSFYVDASPKALKRLADNGFDTWTKTDSEYLDI